jgi:hypothetical protein
MQRWRYWLWFCLLVAASIGFSLGFACAAPLAAFGAATALTSGRRDALLLTGAVWFANQLVGFAFLGYPTTADTFAWGLVMGIVALVAAVASQATVRRLVDRNVAVILLASFGVAFIVYEAGLFVVAATMLGGTEDYAPAIVARILEINAAAFVGLLALYRLGLGIGLAAKSATPLFAAARHA